MGPLPVANGVARVPGQRAAAQPARGAGYLRPLLAGLLLAVVLVGIRSAVPPVGQGRWHDQAVLIAAVVEPVLAALLAATLILGRLRPGPGHPAALLRLGLQRTIMLMMVAAAAFAVFSKLRLHPKPVSRPGQAARPGRHKLRGSLPTTTAHSVAFLPYLLYGLVALLLLAAVIACVIALTRRLQSGPEGALDLADDESESLRQAVESGRSALRAVDDARAAIIACYVAMEGSLARAGAARAAAETPDELLARATASGLLSGSAAGLLTRLFYEARFSSHPLPASVREDAMRALNDISAELAGASGRTGAARPVPQPAGAGPAGAGSEGAEPAGAQPGLEPR
jgi:Domain of unknown function (DUF4129)